GHARGHAAPQARARSGAPAPHRDGTDVRLPDRALAKQQPVGDSLGDGFRLAARAIRQDDDGDAPIGVALDRIAKSARFAGMAPASDSAVTIHEPAKAVFG